MISLEIAEFFKVRSITEELNKLKAERPSAPPADLSLFQKYITHFNHSSRVIKFLKDHDFADTFHKSDIEPLWDYVDCWNGPQIEFIDNKLEIARLHFDQAVRRFVQEMVNNTFAHDFRPGFYTMDYNQVHHRPELKTTRQKLNQLSRDAHHAFEEFYRLGKWTFKDHDFS